MLSERFSLEGQAAIVTGAGRGIGAATAIALAEAGSDVVLAARTEEQLEAVAEKVRAAGRHAVVVATDLADTSTAQQLVDRAVAEFGRLDVVVGNVGGAMPDMFANTSVETLEQAFHFNVSTAHALAQAAAPHLVSSDNGAVVVISSAIGHVADRGFLAYGTVKAALSHWTRLAAQDLGPRIRVNAVLPGSTMTSALEMVAGDEHMMHQMESATALGRVGDPAEIAAAVVFLASPAASYVSGALLPVDGGMNRPSLDLGLPDFQG